MAGAELGAGVGSEVDGAGLGAGVGSEVDGAGLGAGVGLEVDGAGVGAVVGSELVGSEVVGAGLGAGVALVVVCVVASVLVGVGDNVGGGSAAATSSMTFGDPEPRSPLRTSQVACPSSLLVMLCASMPGNAPWISATVPATSGVAMLVPDFDVNRVSPALLAEIRPDPGAKMSTQLPKFDLDVDDPKSDLKSCRLVEPTVMALATLLCAARARG